MARKSAQCFEKLEGSSIETSDIICTDNISDENSEQDIVTLSFSSKFLFSITDSSDKHTLYIYIVTVDKRTDSSEKLRASKSSCSTHFIIVCCLSEAVKKIKHVTILCVTISLTSFDS